MSETMCYADNFSRSFGEQQECLEFLREREENASWRSIPTREVRFEAIDEGSTSSKVLCDWYRLMGKEGILQDTMANTKLLHRDAGHKNGLGTKCLKAALLSAR